MPTSIIISSYGENHKRGIDEKVTSLDVSYIPSEFLPLNKVTIGALRGKIYDHLKKTYEKQKITNPKYDFNPLIEGGEQPGMNAIISVQGDQYRSLLVTDIPITQKEPIMRIITDYLNTLKISNKPVDKQVTEATPAVKPVVPVAAVKPAPLASIAPSAGPGDVKAKIASVREQQREKLMQSHNQLPPTPAPLVLSKKLPTLPPTKAQEEEASWRKLKEMQAERIAKLKEKKGPSNS